MQDVLVVRFLEYRLLSEVAIVDKFFLHLGHCFRSRKYFLVGTLCSAYMVFYGHFFAPILGPKCNLYIRFFFGNMAISALRSSSVCF